MEGNISSRNLFLLRLVNYSIYLSIVNIARFHEDEVSNLQSKICVFHTRHSMDPSMPVFLKACEFLIVKVPNSNIIERTKSSRLCNAESYGNVSRK